ncbi:hypothetical protein PVK06_008973 [Gossypium arboreum]|uniref:DUF4283 domain-containing protein n=1 Tax=Gossypium arboreum TaxID=29729 RepID=A0ABR0QLB2_GOSAR|nr:hypothetical protein PVK06_008973 [Gossypium arboreum]
MFISEAYELSITFIDGVPAITFSDRIKDILLKEIELTVIVKLIGRNIVKFQAADDYNRVLTQGPWIVYRSYLTVQHWTKHFSPSQPYPSVVIVDGAIQRVKYEALLTICFAYGKYGHVKETCPSVVTDQNSVVTRDESLSGVALPNGGSLDNE